MNRAVGWAPLGLLLACQQPAQPSQDEAEPQPNARASIVDPAGASLDPLGPERTGAAVLLFVSTDCPISNRYAPTMARLSEAWGDQGVTAWLVYPDPDDDGAAIEAHRREFSLPLPAVRDPQHLLVAQAGARVTPEAAVFEPGGDAPAYTGRIDDRVVELGKVRAEAGTHELRDAVSAVLAGRSPAPAGAPAIGCYISDLR